ncbi:MAG: DUF401 family protein [Sedimentibacter sp.]|uniref:DUF401 family protein n=1 Tax=Sedimentibacter sp. TaxID=1960295 RepID=UPI002981F994|nr:DUF401 family protein [Sedimentibacter sp.]MDW5298567.1 DUF401 family protein [Sedimentibacter sp.]
MTQIFAVLISFSFIPLLSKTKLKLSYILLITAGSLAVTSGIGIEAARESVLNVFIESSSLNTILTVMMVSILGGLMKYYKILEKIVETIMNIICNKKNILVIIPAVIGVLIIPGGALLSAPFINDIGEEMNIPSGRRAAINLVFRHIAMFILPYSTGLLVISATIPDISIPRLVVFNLFYVIPMLIIGYLLYIKNIKSENLLLRKNIGINVYKLALYTSPIYICVIINAITGLPFYITMIASVFIVYLLGDKNDFLRITCKSLNWQIVLMVITVLLMKEIILKMDGLLLIFSNMFNESNNMISILIIFLIFSIFFGYITGNQTAALAIILPMISQLDISLEMMHIYIYFSFVSTFIGYFFSPIHLCQAFTIHLMNVSTSELYKEYKLYAPIMLLLLFVSVFILKLLFA